MKRKGKCPVFQLQYWSITGHDSFKRRRILVNLFNSQGKSFCPVLDLVESKLHFYGVRNSGPALSFLIPSALQ